MYSQATDISHPHTLFRFIRKQDYENQNGRSGCLYERDKTEHIASAKPLARPEPDKVATKRNSYPTVGKPNIPCACFALTVNRQTKQKFDYMNATNPFAEPNYGTPYNTVPFDRIRLEDYESAMTEGMKQEEDAIRNIIAETGEPTFENVILPETDQLLSRATTVFFNLTSANTNDEMDALAQKMTPLLTALLKTFQKQANVELN